MNALIEHLSTVCAILLLPVLVALLVFLAATVVLAGGFVREWLGRRRARASLDACLDAAKAAEDPASLWLRLRAGRSGLMAAFHLRLPAGVEAQPAVLGHAVTELEHDIAAALARLALLTRIGPMIGLMGTLIPLGPALTGLAAGDIQTLSQNLVVAFATTVLGVLIGSLAYGIAVVRRGWYARDLSDLEFICQRLAIPLADR